MRRKVVFLIAGLVLGSIIIAAIVAGAVIGVRNNREATVVPPAESPVVVQAPYDVIAGSPIKALAFKTNNTQNGEMQNIRIHYQTINGNVKQMSYDGVLAGWQNAKPIFTDARNHTGLASYSYYNGSALTGALFYVGTNGNLQEKRMQFGTPDPWLPGTLNKQNFKVMGDFTLQSNDSAELNPDNNWDGYKISAAYSANFADGPGARLYYHFTAQNGSQWVQELRWYQNEDTWEAGVAIPDVMPNSDLTALVDERHKAVRVFYCTGNGTLQEAWQNITEGNSTYNIGLQIPNLLHRNNADFDAIAVNNSVLVYYYSTGVVTPGIQELNITGAPNFIESINNGSSLVAAPALLWSVTGAVSIYTPMAAILTDAAGAAPAVHVIFADNTVSRTSGYSRLSDISRPLDRPEWPPARYGSSDAQIMLPLGTETADVPPSSGS